MFTTISFFSKICAMTKEIIYAAYEEERGMSSIRLESVWTVKIEDNHQKLEEKMNLSDCVDLISGASLSALEATRRIEEGDRAFAYYKKEWYLIKHLALAKAVEAGREDENGISVVPFRRKRTKCLRFIIPADPDPYQTCVPLKIFVRAVSVDRFKQLMSSVVPLNEFKNNT